MLGGPGGDDHEANKRMADLQVKSSFIQFFIAVGLINLGKLNFKKDRREFNALFVHYSSICY